MRSSAPAIFLLIAIMVYGTVAESIDGVRTPEPLTCAEAVSEIVGPPTDERVVRVATVNCKTQTVTGTGTGWVGPDGRIITAQHVIDDPGHHVYVRTRAGSASISNITVNPQHDIALMEPADDLVLPAALQLDMDLTLGEPARAYGHTSHSATTHAELVRSGQITDQYGQVSDAYTGTVMRGYSGGPIINEAGLVEGMTYAMATEGDTAMAVPASVIASMLRPSS